MEAGEGTRLGRRMEGVRTGREVGGWGSNRWGEGNAEEVT